MRAEPEREERIRLAAQLRHQSVSSFVLDAASERAESVIAEAAVTVVPADFFDELLAALARPAEVSDALSRVARAPRRYTPR